MRCEKKAAPGSDGEAATLHRVFVGKMPFVVSASELRASLVGGASDAPVVDWLHDRKTGIFYGSAFVGMISRDSAERTVARAAAGEITLSGKKLKVTHAPPREGEAWPAEEFVAAERPRIM